MNLNGYPFVLPDMIGGNGYNHPPSDELFVRWLQANTFMPSLQFSYVPWDYDDKVIAISQLYTKLHELIAPYIQQRFELAVNLGVPVNVPIWWYDPYNQEAYKVWDEYLLGEDILVAPILNENQTSRDIYLPSGTWIGVVEDDVESFEGNQWLRNFSAPIEMLPFFIKYPAKDQEPFVKLLQYHKTFTF